MGSVSNTSAWKVFCCNVRGLNSEGKWNSIRDKITESPTDIVCLQETKKESFDLAFYPQNLSNAFEFLPSLGASGGVITIWKSRFFYWISYL